MSSGSEVSYRYPQPLHSIAMKSLACPLLRALCPTLGALCCGSVQVPDWLCYDFPPDVRAKLAVAWGKDWKGQAQKW